MPPRDERLIELLNDHRQQLFGFIFSMVHRLADAEDVFQQTSLILWQKFDQFQPGTNFIAWACSIARCQAIDHLRSQKRDKLCFSETLLGELAERQQEESEILTARTEALESCKQKLTENDRSMLDACYRPGVSIKEASSTLGRNVESVYTSLSRIRRSLASCIQQQLTLEME